MKINARVAAVVAPPIADVQQWISGLSFTPERPLLDVAQAVPSYEPADQLVHFIGEIALRPESSRYTPILGIPGLRQALSEHLSQDYNAAIDVVEVGITAGCNQAFCLAMSALAGPGDEVILPLPYYFNHQMWLQMQRGTCGAPTHADRWSSGAGPSRY